MYWVWKNSHAKVVGTCHYRRYLLNEQENCLQRHRFFLCCSSMMWSQRKNCSWIFLIMRICFSPQDFISGRNSPCDTGDLSGLCGGFSAAGAAKAHLFRKYADCKKKFMMLIWNGCFLFYLKWSGAWKWKKRILITGEFSDSFRSFYSMSGSGTTGCGCMRVW